MKLTKAQQKVIDRIKEQHEEATTMSFEDWAEKNLGLSFVKRNWGEREYQKRLEFAKKTYAMHVNDKIFFTIASSNTLRALERMGLIEIVKDGRRNLDHVKALFF